MAFTVEYTRALARKTGEPVREDQARRAMTDAYDAVTNDVPAEALEDLRVEEDVPEGGLDLEGRALVEVFVGGQRAFRIHQAQRDDDHYSTGSRGRYVYYVQSGTLHVRPHDAEAKESAYAYLLEPPTWTGDVREVSLPRALHELYLTYGAARLIEERMRVIQARVPDEADYPDPPTVPAAPQISATDAEALAPTATTIEALPETPTLASVADRYPGESEVTITAPTTPDPPTAPTVDPTLPDPPTYSGPTDVTISASDYDERYSDDDVEMGQLAIERIRSQVEEFQAEVQQALGQFQSEVQAYSAEVQALIEEGRLDVDVFQGEVRAYATEVESVLREFSETVGAELQKWRTEGELLQAFQGLELQAARASLQAELTAFEAEVQKALQQAQIAAQEAAQTAEQATQVDLQNKARALEADVRGYELQLQRFQGQLQRYQAEVEQAVTAQQAEIDRRQQRVRMMKFDLDRLRREYAERKAGYLRKRHRAPTISPTGPLPL